MAKDATNLEGLTFREWMDAALAWAGYEPDKLTRETYREAWMAGEDPTEYAATFK